jgi:uncharacterized repeat protein (TIGR03803 family)
MSTSVISTSARPPVFLALALTAIVLLAGGAQAQNYQILHFFTGNEDGNLPSDSPTLDSAGNVYGTSQGGYFAGCGNVFKFAPKPDGTWTETVLTTFDCSGADGRFPHGEVIFDKTGNLYGTTNDTGALGGGTVFKLSPNPGGTWTRTILHNFAGSPNDGSGSFGGVVFDAAGNLYGETCFGGASNLGTVFQLKPEPDGSWTEKVLHSFQGGTDGRCPFGSPTFDGAGNNLYGATYGGGNNAQCTDCGTVFQLQRNQNWKENVIHTFTGGADGIQPLAGVTWARPNTLYGTTMFGGTTNQGTVYQVVLAKGAWTESVIYSFPNGLGGAFPQSSLVLDGRNLYGTAQLGGTSHDQDAGGTVFKLEFLNGQWSAQVLHSFDGPPHDGTLPISGVALRREATRMHIFGMTWRGGPEQCVLGCGILYEITQKSPSAP